MHEAGLIRSLVKKINAIAAEHGASAVSKVYLQIGLDNMVSQDHMVEHFRRAAKGSPSQEASIEFETSNDFKSPDPTLILLKGVELAYLR